MSHQKSEYKEILKSTSIFGGVQIIQILVQIVRSKLIAYLMGPSGIGVFGLLNNIIGLITGITGFGLVSSAIKDIAQANESGNEVRVSTISYIVNRFFFLTAILGGLITIIFSSSISQIIFGNEDFRLSIIWLSISVFFTQISSGQIVLIQGMRKLKNLAFANLIGSVVGLIISIPVYFIYGINGIIPSLVLASIITFLVSWFYYNKLKIKPMRIPLKDIFFEGKNMASLGFVINFTTLMALGFTFLIRVYINKNGSVEDVGLYSAGFSIIISYLGVIFSAMGTDYFPRLASVALNNERAFEVIGKQSIVTILILSPLLITFFVFINWVILLLYSNSFTQIIDMMLWAGLGMFFKACTWPMGFLFVAKGENRVYFWNEFTSNIYILTLSIIGYELLGLKGLGIAYGVSYLITFIQVVFIMKFKYEFLYNKETSRILFYQFILTFFSFISVIFLTGVYYYLVGVILICITILFSYVELEKRLGVRNLLNF